MTEKKPEYDPAAARRARATKERKALLVRLNPELHDALRRWADHEMRSLNAHIEYLLREAVRRRERGG